MNLELLRLAHVRRVGVKGGAHIGQRRIFFVLDRATKKFPGSLALWLQYIEYAKKQKSHKKLSQIFSTALRLHPANPELWIHAANHALIEREDVTEARNYLQRGLRFKNQSKVLWIEFARLEMVYIDQISKRSRVLGLEEVATKNPRTKRQSEDEDLILLPNENNSDTALDTADQQALKALISTPVVSGAIAQAVYDSSMAIFPQDIELKTQIFDLFADFGELSCAPKLCKYVSDDLTTTHPTTPEALSCRVRLPFIGIDPYGPEFAVALIGLLDSSKVSEDETLSIDACYHQATSALDKANFASRTLLWIVPYLLMEGIDDACVNVLRQVTRTVWHHFQVCTQGDASTEDLNRLVKIKELICRCHLEE